MYNLLVRLTIHLIRYLQYPPEWLNVYRYIINICFKNTKIKYAKNIVNQLYVFLCLLFYFN